MKKDSLTENYIYNVAYQVLALIVPLITTPYVSRVLGATSLGEYGFTSGIVSYFGILAATGTVDFSKREIAYRQNNLTERSKLFYEVFYFRLISILLVSILYIIFILCFSGQYRKLYIIQFITVFSWLFDISWFFQGMENFKVTTLRNSLVKIASTISIFIFVRNTQDLPIYIFILCLSGLIGNLSVWFYKNKYITHIPFSSLKIFRNTKEILVFFIATIAIQFYTVLDQTMLGIISNTTEVGYYTQAMKIIKLALTVITSLSFVLLPRISSLYVDGKLDRVKHYIQLSLSYLYTVSVPMVVGCVVLAADFVPLFYGPGFAPVTGLLRILSILFIVLGTGQIAGSVLIAIGGQKRYTLAVTGGAIINFILNSFLIRNYGSIGASIASVLAEGFVTSFNFLAIINLVKVNRVFRSFIISLINSLAMGLLIILILKIPVPSLIRLLLSGATGVFGYISLLFIEKNPLLSQLLVKFKKKTQ